MKKIKTLLVTLFAVFIAFGMMTSASASIYTVPADANKVWTANGSPSTLKLTQIYNITGYDNTSAIELYNSAGTGLYAPSYSTTFSDGKETATIGQVGSTFMNAGILLLYVKDGNNKPIHWIFDVSNWDRVSPLYVSQLWPDQGSISHVSFYGIDTPGTTSTVPIPPSVWLLGAGLIGLIGVRRRFQK